MLQVKGNQSKLLQTIKQEFDLNMGKYCTKIEKNKGRNELRTCQVLPLNNPKYPQIKNIVCLTTKVSKLENTTKSESYFISDLTETPEFFLNLKRNHWSIEAFHYKKDVTLKEDATKTKSPTIDGLLNSLLCNIFSSHSNLKATLRQLANQPLLAYNKLNSLF
jgi:predicted transposase YbfD/YdcC